MAIEFDLPPARRGAGLLPPCVLNFLGGSLASELDEAIAAGQALGRELADCRAEGAAAAASLEGALGELQRASAAHEAMRTALGLAHLEPPSPEVVLPGWQERSPFAAANHDNTLPNPATGWLRKDCEILKRGLIGLTQSMMVTLSSLPTLEAADTPGTKTPAAQQNPPSPPGGGRAAIETATSRASLAEAKLARLAADAEASAAASRKLHESSPELQDRVAGVMGRLEGLGSDAEAAGEVGPAGVLAMRDWIKKLEEQQVESMTAAEKLTRENEILLAQIEQLEKNLAIITEEKAQRAGQLQGELMEVCIWASELENECDKLEQDCVRMYSLLDAEAREKCHGLVSNLDKGQLAEAQLAEARLARVSAPALTTERAQSPQRGKDPATPKGKEPASPNPKDTLRVFAEEDEDVSEDDPRRLMVQRSPSESGFISQSILAGPSAPRDNQKSTSLSGIEGRSASMSLVNERGNSMRRFSSLKRPPQLQLYRSMSAMSGTAARNASRRGSAPGQQPGPLQGWMAQTEQLHFSIQGKAREAREVLITRLESALERISAAESALAEKNREIKALKAEKRVLSPGTPGSTTSTSSVTSSAPRQRGAP